MLIKPPNAQKVNFYHLSVLLTFSFIKSVGHYAPWGMPAYVNADYAHQYSRQAPIKRRFLSHAELLIELVSMGIILLVILKLSICKREKLVIVALPALILVLAFDLDEDSWLAMRTYHGTNKLSTALLDIIQELRQNKPHDNFRIFVDKGAYHGKSFQKLKKIKNVHF